MEERGRVGPVRSPAVSRVFAAAVGLGLMRLRLTPQKTQHLFWTPDGQIAACVSSSLLLTSLEVGDTQVCEP